MKLLIIVPAYNEVSAIGRVINELGDVVDLVMVVDDGSSDSTGEVATRAGALVVRHFLNRGQGAALQTGIEAAIDAGADIIVTFDADGQFVASDVPKVIEPLLLSRADIVFGSRFLQANEIPAPRRFILRAAALITWLYTGVKLSDVHNGFRAFSRLTAEAITISQQRMAHASEFVEQVAKHELRYEEVPVTVRYTEYSLRKGQRVTSSLRIIWDLFFSRLK